jgi:hypothetical protein
MKLSWRDLINTMLVVAGGSIVYAKYYNYSWAGLGSWWGAVAWLAIIGLVMFALSSFNFVNRSILNIGEMILGVLAVILAIVGVIMTSQFVFYSLAVVLGVVWVVDTARHARHSIIGGGTTTYHHAAPVH